MSPIAINRADRKRAMQRLIEHGAERFRQGFSIMVYPEGTRIAVGRRGVYRLGGAVIAANTGAGRASGRAQRRRSCGRRTRSGNIRARSPW